MTSRARNSTATTERSRQQRQPGFRFRILGSPPGGYCLGLFATTPDLESVGGYGTIRLWNAMPHWRIAWERRFTYHRFGSSFGVCPHGTHRGRLRVSNTG